MKFIGQIAVWLISSVAVFIVGRLVILPVFGHDAQFHFNGYFGAVSTFLIWPWLARPWRLDR